MKEYGSRDITVWLGVWFWDFDYILAQEITFSRKIQKSSQPSLIFNINTVTESLT